MYLYPEFLIQFKVLALSTIVQSDTPLCPVTACIIINTGVCWTQEVQSVAGGCAIRFSSSISSGPVSVL